MAGKLLHLEASDPQLEACQRWADKSTDVIVFGGAKYGGKSYLGANLIFGDALTYPDTAYFIARQQLNDLRKHTVLTISEVFRDWGVKMDDYVKFNGMDNYYECLRTKSPVFFLEGKAQPSDPMFERWGSTQFTRGWIEEGGEFADLAIENLEVTVGRKNNAKYGLKSKVLITCNPKRNLLYRKFYKPWSKGTLPDNLAFIRSLATDNVKGDPDYIRKLSQMKDPTMRARLWAGDWEYDDDPATLMGFDAIQDLFTNDFVPTGEKALTCDVARYGSDKTVIMLWDGLRVEAIHTYSGQATNITARNILEIARYENVPRSRIVVDDDGVGGGVVDLIKGCVAFRNGSKAIEIAGEPQDYANLKAQCSYVLSQMVNKAKVYIATEEHRETICEELAWIKRDKMDHDGKLRILPKEKVKEGLGRSPDFADNLMMRMILELQPDYRTFENSIAIQDERFKEERYENFKRDIAGGFGLDYDR